MSDAEEAMEGHLAGYLMREGLEPTIQNQIEGLNYILKDAMEAVKIGQEDRAYHRQLKAGEAMAVAIQCVRKIAELGALAVQTRMIPEGGQIIWNVPKEKEE